MSFLATFLAAKLWLSLSEPSLIEEIEDQPKGFSKTPKSREGGILTPRWLGRNYQTYVGSQKELESQEEREKGTHRSPEPHWRRGHQRTVRYGPGRSLTKKVWIEKKFVNGPATKQQVAN